MAHDIPNHLNTASLSLELAKEDRSFEDLDMVETAHTRVETLTEDLQTLVQAGTPVVDEEPIELSTVVTQCWQSCCSEDDPTTFRITEDGTVHADRNRLKQLFENLFWNACEHAGEDITVRVGLSADGFYVADDGRGIPSGDPTEVFSPTYTTVDGPHRGFGLAIVDEIASAHGWDVEVTESEDGGARFEFVDVTTAVS